MTARRQPILRFEIDPEEITLGHLIRIEGIVSKLIREVTAEVVGRDARAIGWIVHSVNSGSPIMYALRPPASEDVEADQVAFAASALAEGLTTLDTGVERPPHFTDEALERARELSRELGTGHVKAIRFYAEDGAAPASITPRLAANVEAVLHEDQYESLGTVEGRLETLSVHDKQYFNVYEDLTGRKVECLFAESGIPLEKIGAAIGSRVGVFGVLTSRDDGRIVRVRVRELDVFPPAELLPSADDIGGIVS